MRILIAGYADEDSFADNVMCALREMGHDVATLGIVEHDRYYAPWRQNIRLAFERVRRAPIDPDGRKLIRLARRLRPHLVLALTREYSTETLVTLKKICNPIRVLWWGDTPANARRMTLTDREWDVLFLKDRHAVAKVRLVRADVHLLHEAMNPRWHRPLSSQKNQNLAVAGNWYGFRQALVNRLLNDGISVDCYGSPLPLWSLSRIREVHKRRYITREEKSRIFGEAMGCLNSFQFSEGDSLNCRAFEIAGAGGLQLIEHRPSIELCFEPGRELLVFQTYEELLEHIERARKHPGEMRLIREAGSRRAHAEHTYRHRLEKILEIIR